MNWKKKLLALGLSLALTLSLTACGQKAAEPEQPEEPAQTEEPAAEAPDGTEADIAHFRIAALKGPTAMGLVKLMKDNDEMTGALLSSAKPYEGEVGNLYTFTLAGSADEVTPALIKGDLDMACVPANLAAVLYGKTDGALEVLAVIAYYQPVTRAYIDQIRGVDSAYTVGLLLDRHLIEECGRLQVPGRPRLYRTTQAFLRAFHLNSLEELPQLPGMEADGQLRLNDDGAVQEPEQ